MMSFTAAPLGGRVSGLAPIAPPVRTLTATSTGDTTLTSTQFDALVSELKYLQKQSNILMMIVFVLFLLVVFLVCKPRGCHCHRSHMMAGHMMGNPYNQGYW